MRIDRLLSRFMLLAALTPCMLPAGAQAAAIYDGFGYPPGGQDLNLRNGGTGWGSAWLANPCCAPTETTASGLSFGALAVTPGAATTPLQPPINVSLYGRVLGTSFGADNATLFFSFLLRPDLNFGFYGGINFAGPGGDIFVGKSGVVPGTADPVPFYSLESGSQISQSGVAAVAGSTVLLVVRARFHDGSDDIFDLYVNPTPGGALPAAPDATLALANLGIGSLFTNNATGWTTDEIRFGATFAEVAPAAAVPAPASALLLACGFAILAATRRVYRRARNRSINSSSAPIDASPRPKPAPGWE